MATHPPTLGGRSLTNRSDTRFGNWESTFGNDNVPADTAVPTIPTPGLGDFGVPPFGPPAPGASAPLRVQFTGFPTPGVSQALTLPPRGIIPMILPIMLPQSAPHAGAGAGAGAGPGAMPSQSQPSILTQDIAEVLAIGRLQKYADGFREVGIEVGDDLQEMLPRTDAPDSRVTASVENLLQRLGMSTFECGRFHRMVLSQVKAAAEAAEAANKASNQAADRGPSTTPTVQTAAPAGVPPSPFPPLIPGEAGEAAADFKLHAEHLIRKLDSEYWSRLGAEEQQERLKKAMPLDIQITGRLKGTQNSAIFTAQYIGGAGAPQKLVIKMPDVSVGADDASGAIRRFHKEMKMHMGLKHTNILMLKGYFWYRGMVLCLILPYVERGSLAALLDERRARNMRPLSTRAVLKLARGIVAGMSYLNKREVEKLKRMIHRDLKPGNVLIGTSEDPLQPVISDFGCARVFDKTTAGITHNLGTASYCAPEVVDHHSVISRKVDVFSFAIILWELLTGEENQPQHVVSGLAQENAEYKVWEAKSSEGAEAKVREATLAGGASPWECRPAHDAETRTRAVMFNPVRAGIWRLMTECWSHYAKNRPDFHDIEHRLRELANTCPVSSLWEPAQQFNYLFQVGHLLLSQQRGTTPRALANAMDAKDSPVRRALAAILAVNGRGKTLRDGSVGWSLGPLENSLRSIDDNERLCVSMLLRNVYNLRHAFDRAPPRGFLDWGDVGSWVAKHYGALTYSLEKFVRLAAPKWKGTVAEPEDEFVLPPTM